VKCEAVREAVSALLDGEDTPVPEHQVAYHLERCPPCEQWQRRAQLVTRQARVAAAPPASDLVGRILAAEAERSRPPRHRDWSVRAGLVLVALLQLAVTVPVLILGHDREAPMHVAHEMGAFDAALAVGLLAAVRRPSRAEGMLALVGAMAVLLCVTAGIDLAAGRTSIQDEAPHLLCVVGWLLLHRLSVLTRSASPADPEAALRPPQWDSNVSGASAMGDAPGWPARTGRTA
jgi:predicted anti-sigma-YlaC factor YlaD